MNHQSIAGRWPGLIIGMGLTIVAGLSVHVIMLQGLHVPYPDNSLVGWPARYLNVALAMLATILFNTMASSRLDTYSRLVRSVLVFLIFSMLHEALIRAAVMDGVVTTAWTYSFLSNLPVLLTNLVICILIVWVSPSLRLVWQKIVAALILAALLWFVCQPLIGLAFSPILNSLSFLAHDEIYKQPYGWHVLVPAYATFAEPVVASFVIAFLVWDRLSAMLWIRTLQFVLLIMLMKGSIVPTLFYSVYLKLDLPTAIASEGQFGLETLIVAVMTALVWQYGYSMPRSALRRSGGNVMPAVPANGDAA